MKRKAKTILQCLGIISAWFALTAVLVCSFFWGFSKLTDKKSQDLIANAGTIDVSAYPSANLLAWEEVTVTGSTQWYSLCMGSVSLPVGVYTMSCRFKQKSVLTSVGFSVRDYNNVLIFLGENISSLSEGTLKVTFNVKDDCFGFSLYLFSNCTENVLSSSCTFSDFMLNVGSTAYPYIPHFDTIYDQGYDVGYDQGQVDYSKLGGLGVLKDVTVSGTVDFYNNDTDSEFTESFSNLSPQFAYESICFDNIAQSFESKYSGTDIGLDGMTVVLNLQNAYSYAAIPIYYRGSSLVNKVTFIATNGTRYVGSILKENEQGLRLMSIPTDIPVGLQIQKIEIVLPTQNECFSSYISINSGSYFQGHTDGFIEGRDFGYTNGYKAGSDDGYKEGYRKGQVDVYAQKAEDGTLADGVSSFLYTLFDAPINAFMSVFSFEIDGFDIGGLVAFILTIVIVVYVYRLLV